MGYVYGFILSCIIIIFNYTNTPKYKLKVIPVTCLVVSITFLTQYFYYILSPKKYWMLETDMTLSQQKAWLHIYKINQWQYHFGLLLGILQWSFYLWRLNVEYYNYNNNNINTYYINIL